MKRAFWALSLACGVMALAGRAQAETDREVWLNAVERIATPVLERIADDRFSETVPHGNKARANTLSFEALARTLNGIAPWLELPADDSPEGVRRAKMLALAHRALATAIQPETKDSITKGKGSQPLVEYAFLAQAFLRSPTKLWGELPEGVRAQWLERFNLSRRITPNQSNWLCFAGEVEAFLWETTGECDDKRLRLPINAFMDGWYKGDGVYGDGKACQLDYYNSYVIHPMLLDILGVLVKHGDAEAPKLLETERRRARRYSTWLERLIAPDGSYPAFGRSLCYRMGAFHILAQTALMKEKLWNLPAPQVRSALTAVIRRQVVDQNFTPDGFLTMGFNGEQPGMCDYYVNRGSLYLCSFIFLPLGLPESDPFWKGAARDWTSKRAWAGEAFPGDHGIP